MSLVDLQTKQPASDAVYISFDIGTINPAFTVGYYKPNEHLLQIIWMEKTNWEKQWKSSISTILSTYRPRMVLIEKQMRNTANVKYMQYIREEAAFRHLYYANVNPPFKSYSKKYKERKNESVDRFLQLVNTIPNSMIAQKWRVYLNKHPKLDDLADSCNMLINYLQDNSSSFESKTKLLRVEFL